MYKNLRAEMARETVTVTDLAKVINKTPRAARDKLLGLSPLTWAEAVAIRDTLFPGQRLEYLYATEEARA